MLMVRVSCCTPFNYVSSESQLLLLKDICSCRIAKRKKNSLWRSMASDPPQHFWVSALFKDHFYGISALLYSSQRGGTIRWQTKGVTCSKGPGEDLNPRCYYCTQPALWATYLLRQSRRDLLTQLYPCPFHRLCTTPSSVIVIQTVKYA